MTGLRPPDQSVVRDRVAIVGVGATVQGLHPGRSQYSLGVEAFSAALRDAGIDDRHDVDGILGLDFRDEGIDPLDFARLIGVAPRVTGQLDYGTAGFMVHYAAGLILAGACEIVACVFARNPSTAMRDFSGGPVVYDHDQGLVNAAGPAALGWARYAHTYGATRRALGHVAVAAHQWASRNPIAAWRDEALTLDSYLAEPRILGDFGRFDIARLTAGGAAIVVTSTAYARTLRKRPVLVHAIGRRQAPFPHEDPDHLQVGAMKDVAAQVYGASGLSAADIELLVMSDASTAAVLLTLEQYGFCGPGEAPDLVAGGAIAPGGSLPVNPSGGQLAEGYLVGWLQQVDMVRQMRGEAGDHQVAMPTVAQYTATGRFRNDYLSTIYVADQDWS